MTIYKTCNFVTSATTLATDHDLVETDRLITGASFLKNTSTCCILQVAFLVSHEFEKSTTFLCYLGFITNPKNGRVKGLKVVSLDRTYFYFDFSTMAIFSFV